MSDLRPTLHLPALSGNLQVVADLYEMLTGRKATEEELAEAVAELTSPTTGDRAAIRAAETARHGRRERGRR